MKSINKNQTFDNILEHEGNRWAIAALKIVIENKNAYHPLYIYGEDGAGKSHLLNATINAIAEQNKVVFLSAENLSEEIVDNLIVSDVDYILIDDMDLFPKNKVLEERLAKLILIGSDNKQLIFTSNVAPDSLEVGGKLQERLRWGLSVSVVSENH